MRSFSNSNIMKLEVTHPDRAIVNKLEFIGDRTTARYTEGDYF